jgi:hypothetical protein
MNLTYMPFTYLSKPVASILHALFGTVAVLQPLKSAIPEELVDLSDQGLIEISAPAESDDERLSAALLEFTEWARMNPGTSLAGAEFFGTRQGEVPFFDETSVNRIRSEIKHHGSTVDERGESDFLFSARLFLALAQENDRATDSLDRDLETFKAMEKDFLASMMDAGDTRFNRQSLGTQLWQEDQGAKLTQQRLRAWATLALAGNLPDFFVTTSCATMETLEEHFGSIAKLEKLAAFTTKCPSSDETGRFKPLVEELLQQTDLSMIDPQSLRFPDVESSFTDRIQLSIYKVANMGPTAFLQSVAPKGLMDEKMADGEASAYTLIFYVECKC